MLRSFLDRAPVLNDKYLSLDLRSLALFRMFLGAIVLLDILLRLRDLQLFYGDRGVLSAESSLSGTWLSSVYHLFLATGTSSGLLFLFFVWGFAACCLMLGYQSRIAGLVTWYFVVSIQLRNPMVIDGGDEFLRLLLFWTPFLPLGARWSLEARRKPQWSSLPNTYRSVCTGAIYLQFAVLYFFAALLKTGDDWWVTKDAVYYALSIDQISTSFGRYLSQFHEGLRYLTTASLGLEFLLAILLLLPGRLTWARTSFLILAAVFHFSVASLLHLGLFMPIVLGSIVVFVPGSCWERKFPSPESADLPDSLPDGYSLNQVSQAFGALCCAYILFVNCYSIKHHHKLTPWAHTVARYLYLHQHWHLFAPYPFREDGFFVIEIQTTEGALDILSLEPLAADGKPPLGSSRFPNQRWRRWFQNLVQIDFPDKQAWRDSTLEYFTDLWIRDHPEAKALSAKLIFVQELTPPPGQKSALEPLLLSEIKSISPKI